MTNERLATLTHCTISNNLGANGGGGIYNDSRGTAALTNCTLSNNWDAAIRNDGKTTLTKCTLSENAGALAGGIDNLGMARVTGCRLNGNSTANWGGGISNYGTAVVANCTFSSNMASVRGGALLNRGRVKVSESTFEANTAARGGAFTNEGHGLLTNCTLSGNVATDAGGAIYNDARGSTRLTNCTLSRNAATDSGGAIFNAGRSVTLRNTIFANSTSGGNCAGAPFKHGTGNLDDGGSCGFSGAGCTLHNGSSFCNTDPKLNPAGLANNGGPTQTIAVQSDSPAIHAGRRCPRIDQRTFARPGVDPATNLPSRLCTIGAYEFNSPGCRTGQTLCTGTCTDLKKDPSNCGACGTAGERCSNGVCK